MKDLKTYLIEYIVAYKENANIKYNNICVINAKDRRQALNIFKNDIYGTVTAINEIRNTIGIVFNKNVSTL